MQAEPATRSLFRAVDIDAVSKQVVEAPIILAPSQAWIAAGVSLALGLLANALFNGAALGINATLWLLAAIAALLFASRRVGRTPDRAHIALLAAAVVFAAMLAWRASPVLQVLNLMTASSLLLLAVALPDSTPVRRLSPVAVALACCVALASMMSSAWRLVGHLPWREKLAPAYRTEALSVGRALALSTPIFLTFGGLFFAADAVFAAEVSDAISLDVGALRAHLLWTLGGAWLAASLLWPVVAIESPEPLEAEMPEPKRLKTLELAIVLGPLALLFGLFVAVQVQYLFGGQDAVRDSISLTYADYARRGFFELVLASVLLLPVLAGVKWARRRGVSSDRIFAMLAVSLVALLLVVMASAAQRLSIYVDAFGLTELRFYAAAILPWLVVVFLWFLAGLAMRTRVSFFAGAGIAALVLVGALNVANPDSLIVRTNLDRTAALHRFDSAYGLRLSADSVPPLLDGLERLPLPERCEVSEALVAGWQGRSDDARGWNWGRWRALRGVAAAESRLLDDCRE